MERGISEEQTTILKGIFGEESETVEKAQGETSEETTEEETTEETEEELKAEEGEESEEAEEEPEEPKKKKKGVEGRIGSLTRQKAKLEVELDLERTERLKQAEEMRRLQAQVAAINDPEPQRPDSSASDEEMDAWVKARDEWKARQTQREQPAEDPQAALFLSQKAEIIADLEKEAEETGGPTWDELEKEYGAAVQASRQPRFVSARRTIQNSANPAKAFVRFAKKLWKEDQEAEEEGLSEAERERARAMTKPGNAKTKTNIRDSGLVTESEVRQAKAIFGNQVTRKGLEKQRKKRLNQGR